MSNTTEQVAPVYNEGAAAWYACWSKLGCLRKDMGPSYSSLQLELYHPRFSFNLVPSHLSLSILTLW